MIYTIILFIEALFLWVYYLFTYTFVSLGLKRKRVTKKTVVKNL